jgi:tetraacyldisaccharide 4'-kinase
LWAARSASSAWLLPLAILFGALTAIRRFAYRSGLVTASELPVPVIIVGNIVVGGTGKTPLVIALVKTLTNHGYRPGVLSRGYRGSYARLAPFMLVDSHDAGRFGDEIVLIKARTHVPCMVGGKRATAGRALLQAHPEIDVLVLDDGLQHYPLKRDIEVAVFDQRGLGNGWLLPAGPLREPSRRLERVDAIAINGARATDAQNALPANLAPQVPRFLMQLTGLVAEKLNAPSERCPLSSFVGRTVTACAGIGHPERFFAMLRAQGLAVVPVPLADHAAFDPALIAKLPGEIVLITEKDAVKWRGVDDARIWVVPVDLSIDAAFFALILGKLHASR